MRTSTSSTGDVERVGGDLRQHRPGAGAEVGRADLDDVPAALEPDPRRRLRLPRTSGRSTTATPVPTSQSPVAPDAGPRVALGPAEALARPAAGTRRGAGSTTACRSRGRPGGRCGSAAPPGRSPSASASSSIATSGPNMPGHSPGARIHEGTGTSRAASRCVVRRFGEAYIDPRRHAGLLRELLDLRGLLDDVDRDAPQAPVGVGGQLHPLDRRRAVAGEGEHLLAGQRELHRPAGHGAGRHRGEHDVGVRRALRAEAAADVRATSPAPARAAARTSSRRPRGPGARPGWSPRA